MTHVSRDSVRSGTESKVITQTLMTHDGSEQFCSDGRCFQQTAAKRTAPSPYEVRKRLGSLKRKPTATVLARLTRKPKWGWSSDGDEGVEVGEAEIEKGEEEKDWK